MIIAVLVLLGCVTGAAAQVNLIKNPGFESVPTPSNLPGEGWWLYEARGKPAVRVERGPAHGGVAAVRLQADADARFALVSSPFDVTPGDELRYEGWVRAEKPAGAGSLGNFGLAFRDAAGRVFDRAYVSTEVAGSEWTLVSGAATVPANAVRAEMHLGFNQAPGTLWFDDVRAVITNPLSFSLARGAQPWTGPQTIALRVINRRGDTFNGSIRALVARQTSEVPVTLGPGAEQVVDVPIALPGIGSFDHAISLIEGGAALRTVKGKFHTTAPLVLLPACPCYHVLGEGNGATRIDARIVVNPGERAGLGFRATLIDASGREVESASADAATGDIAGVTLHVPVGTAADFTVTARLLDAAGKELAAAKTDIHVRPPAESQVTVGADGFLRVAGKSHFPIGMYSCGRYEEMGRAGFSGTHNYGITTGEAGDAINPNEATLKQLLDRSAANGMRMMVELPRKAIEKAQWTQVRRRIETFRHHPGLLCWGSEERVARGDAPLANLAALYGIVRELDPDHPLVLGDTRDVITKLQQDRRNFFPDDCMDAGIWWWYPIPLHAPDANGLDAPNAGLLQPPSWLTTTLSKKPLWIAIQSYQQPRKDARFPTPAEYRCMAYLSVINGVKGLWFYTGSGQRDWQGKPSGLLNKPDEGHWDYVQQLVRELRDLEPVITAKAGAGTIKLSPADAPVEFTTRTHDGAFYLFAANKSDRPQAARFTGGVLAGRKVKILHEDQSAAIADDTLRGEFGPFGVHIYRID